MGRRPRTRRVQESHSAATVGTVAWRIHPARSHPAATVAALAAIVSLAAAGAGLMESWWWGAFCGVVLTAALNRFFLPSRFQIDDSGVTARYPLRTVHYRWNQIRRLHGDGRGGYVSTRAVESPLDSFRGIHLTFGQDGDSVIEVLRRRVQAEGRQSCDG